MPSYSDGGVRMRKQAGKRMLIKSSPNQQVIDADNLAALAATYAKRYDPYGYMDESMTNEELVAQTRESLLSDRAESHGLLQYFDTQISDFSDDRDATEQVAMAKSIRSGIQTYIVNYFNKDVPSVSVNNRVATQDRVDEAETIVKKFAISDFTTSPGII